MKTVGSPLAIALLSSLVGCAALDAGPASGPGPERDAALEGEGALGEARAALTATKHYVIRSQGGNCIDVPYAAHASGTQAIAHPCNDQLNQAFGLVFYGTSVEEVVEGKEVQIVARHSGKCLDVEYGSAAGGARIIQWDCHDGANQRWYLWALPGGKLGLKSKSSGLCLAGAPDGAGLIQADCAATPDARRVWGFEPTIVPGPPPADMVYVLFRDDFDGEAIGFNKDVPDLRDYPGWNDVTSAVKLSPGGFISVYSDINYEGTCETIFTNTPSLFKRAIGNDTISSVRLGSHCRSVVLWEHDGNEGDSISFSNAIQNLVPWGWNDRVTSMQLSPGTPLTIYEHKDFGGACQNKTADTLWLPGTYVGNDELTGFRFGYHCAQRNVGVKNASDGLRLKYAVSEGGSYDGWSDAFDEGERLGTVFNDTREVEILVAMKDIYTGYYANICTVPVTTSINQTIVVTGDRFEPECSLTTD